MAKTKEKCLYTEAVLIPYDGDNTFKIGTSQCTGCGIRVNSETGEPTEGASCPINNRVVAGQNVEQSQEIISQLQKSVDDKVEAALKEERIKLKDEHAAEVNAAKLEVKVAKEEHAAAMAELRENHTKEIRALKEEQESTLEEINTKHAKELAAAKAPSKQ